jgi:hypothetical protein
MWSPFRRRLKGLFLPIPFKSKVGIKWHRTGVWFGLRSHYVQARRSGRKSRHASALWRLYLSMERRSQMVVTNAIGIAYSLIDEDMAYGSIEHTM